jgi:hypothetical protein
VHREVSQAQAASVTKLAQSSHWPEKRSVASRATEKAHSVTILNRNTAFLPTSQFWFRSGQHRPSSRAIQSAPMEIAEQIVTEAKAM